jgi:outer membrane lipoprotein SlyB
MMTKKFLIFVAATAVAAFSLSGCSAIQSVTSEAYALGQATGKEYADLKEGVDNLQSWIPEGDGSESAPILEGGEEAIGAYCEGIWAIAGITSGLANTPDNESDFIAGCLNGAGF